MKISHWTFHNGSGLSNVAEEMSAGDRLMGLDSVVCDTEHPETWDQGMDADIFVVHSHVPDKISFDKSKKIILIPHGSPEHVFEISVRQGIDGGYAPGDSFALIAYFLRRANAICTFWPRHVFIWQTMTDRPVYGIPMGIDPLFWAKQEVPPLAGNPAIFTCENAHNVKWPLDMFLLWPYLMERFPDARLHATNIPTDQHRWWWPLSYMNTSRYTAFMTAMRFDHPTLRNYLSAAMYYYSPVRYGDFNRICLEASSCGCKVISHEGNSYAHYWIHEGDQRKQLDDLTEILSGNVEPREAAPVSTTLDMAEAMLQVYERVLA